MANEKYRMGILIACMIIVLFAIVISEQSPAYDELDLRFMRADLITICVVRMDIEMEECTEMFDDVINHMPDETWDCYEPYKDNGDWTNYRNGARIIQCIANAAEKN